MAKEVVISTSNLNSYGSRVLTSGLDISQYERNPILLWMHRRCFNGETLPIGTVENLRVDGDKLIGTPVFDMEDEFAAKIARKWERGVLRMVSAGVAIKEVSNAPEHLLHGQTRATIIRSTLDEVSIVDIGSNAEALQLYNTSGERMTFAAGEQCATLPLLEVDENSNKEQFNNNQKQSMNKEFLTLLGLSETSTEQEALGALRLLKEKADGADALMRSTITTLVDDAVSSKRITAEQKAHFVSLGESAGVESLRTTLGMMHPQAKPTDVLHQQTDSLNQEEVPTTFAKLSEVPAAQLEKMREENPQEYERLYKAEYGMQL